MLFANASQHGGNENARSSIAQRRFNEKRRSGSHKNDVREYVSDEEDDEGGKRSTTEFKDLEAELERLKKENQDLRRALEKNNKTMKNQEKHLAVVNANYSQAMVSAKLHWETSMGQTVVKYETIILKWKHRYDELLDDYKALKTTCARNANQAKTGQMIERVDRTLISLNSGKFMRVGGEGGIDGAGENNMLNSSSMRPLTTMETLKRANKVNGNVTDSLFECLTSKKSSDERNNVTT